MYAGHVAIALAARRLDDEVPLAPFVAASLAPDLLVVRSAHHLAVTVPLAAFALVAVHRVWRSGAGALACGLLVLSHYATDFFTGQLRVWTDGTPVGLRLYDRPAIDLAMEAVVIVAAWLAWRGRFDLRDRRLPGAALVVLLAFQVLFDVTVAGDLLA